MPHRRKHSTSKVNRKVNPRLSLFPPPRPRHLLLLMLILLRQVQPADSHAPFHCGPVSFFFSAVHLSRMKMGTNTASSRHLYHLCSSFVIIVTSLFTPRMCVFYLTTSSVSFNAMPQSLPFNLKPSLETCPGCKSRCCTFCTLIVPSASIPRVRDSTFCLGLDRSLAQLHMSTVPTAFPACCSKPKCQYPDIPRS
ncbi:hypothetical protein EV702DRAFT_668637 [Suillus placidus]|uniref:Uncharacterized protein n=1 Tax=Suillus placidus TaxID=48579 RepID=A0A9P6ZLI7_9AGAM|nr:hypothetical protein EV702DRAFT_668637 [Suillus placidus]